MKLRWSGFRGRDGVLGGDLVDNNTLYAMRDKIQHLIMGALVYLLAARWFLAPWLCVLGVAILCEIIEGVRYARYGYSRPLADEPDVADIVATMLGGVAGWALLW